MQQCHLANLQVQHPPLLAALVLRIQALLVQPLLDIRNLLLTLFPTLYTTEDGYLIDIWDACVEDTQPQANTASQMYRLPHQPGMPRRRPRHMR